MVHARFCLLPLLLSSLGLGASVCAPPDAPSAVKRAAGSQTLHILGIRDAGLVDDFIYRGAQPNDEGLEALKKLGGHNTSNHGSWNVAAIFPLGVCAGFHAPAANVLANPDAHAAQLCRPHAGH
jgi:hypothetical protein